jgi:ubiquinone/menaquinone biosynthesis C-methylase UbiE
MLALICDSLPFNENDAVLDYGCGAGDYTFYISSRCKKIIGLDISVVKAKTRFKNIDFRRQDSDKKIELDSNSVDKIICINVIEHAKEYKKLLKDLKRVLKPGGWLFITTFDREFVLHNLHNDSTHVFEWNKKEFEEFISVEFDIVKSIKYGSFFNYYPLNKLITKVLKPELCLVATKRF